MTPWYPILAVLIASLVCAYLRTGLRTWTIAGFVALFAARAEGDDLARPLSDIGRRKISGFAGENTPPGFRSRIGRMRVEHLLRHQADIGLAPCGLMHLGERRSIRKRGAPDRIFHLVHGSA